MPGPTTLTLPSSPWYDPTETSPNCSPGPDSSPPRHRPNVGPKDRLGGQQHFGLPLLQVRATPWPPRAQIAPGPLQTLQARVLAEVGWTLAPHVSLDPAPAPGAPSL